MRNPTDLETIQKARPYLRSILAFVGYLRFGQTPLIAIHRHYEVADMFLEHLRIDVEEQEQRK